MWIKMKDGFIVRQIADSWVAVPTGERADDVSGLISLSESGAFLWDCLTHGAQKKSCLKN